MSELLAPAWAGTGAGELVDDRALLAAMLDTEAALAEAQAELGAIPETAAKAIRAVEVTDLDRQAIAAGVRETANPVVAFVTALTAAVDPAAAEYVHRGSTSQDILDTALMLLCASTLDRVERDLRTTAASLADHVRTHRDTPMAGRTLTQHAVPVTFGLKAATWLHGVLDAVERVRRARADLPVSLGGAAGTLAAYEEYAAAGKAALSRESAASVLPDRVAEKLGLAPQVLPWHGIRTPIADVASALLVTTGALGKIAADVLVLARTEIGEVTEERAPGRGASSAMPQKHNPVFATLVATAARQLPALAVVLFGSMTAEDERSSGGWHAEWQPLRDALRIAAGAAANGVRLAETLRVHPEAMAANLRLTRGAIVSERVNAVLAPKLGKAAAKRLLTEATAEAERTGADLAGLLDVSPGLLDPAGYTGLSGPLADRALARFEHEERR
ncbi:adenylosuccinate lyase family protein [Amycolatopsis sp. NPDC098790]|uniref:class-II fumarase/aspartase family protein n=1 Tax=Amycolatopsis sp. NPDC098790 TaxID=3363939 RepID=UPI00380244E1